MSPSDECPKMQKHVCSGRGIKSCREIDVEIAYMVLMTEHNLFCMVLNFDKFMKMANEIDVCFGSLKS